MGSTEPTRTSEHLSRICPGTRCLFSADLALGGLSWFTPLSYLWCVADMRKDEIQAAGHA